MGIDFTVFKGSRSGEIVESKGHREVGPTQALVELTHCGVCGVSFFGAQKRVNPDAPKFLKPRAWCMFPIPATIDAVWLA